jgi:Fe-S oxidoreductase
MKNLIPDSDAARQLTENTFTLSEFLEKKLNGYKPPQVNRRAIVQGHCHHKAIMRLKEERALMDKAGLDYQVLESGCCGMAGSFGYEQDKYKVSIDCGERALLPEVRQTGISTIVIADGFSCKEQIAQETNRHALHLAEVLQMGLQPEKETHMYPERSFVEPRKAAQKRSMIKAGIIAGAVLVAASAGIVWARRKA